MRARFGATGPSASWASIAEAKATLVIWSLVGRPRGEGRACVSTRNVRCVEYHTRDGPRRRRSGSALRSHMTHVGRRRAHALGVTV